MKKKAIIITDGAESTARIARVISQHMTSIAPEYTVSTTTSWDTGGADMLAAELIVVGAEQAHTASFAYIEKFLSHVNLAGRRAGVFSPQSAEAAAWLAHAFQDTDARLCPVPFIGDEPDRRWVAEVIQRLDLDAYIRKIPDFPKKGILFYDITSILTTPKAFTHCIDRMIQVYHDRSFGAVAAIEARGFVFGAPFAERMGLPLILVRKKGKLPGVTVSRKYTLEYAETEVEIHPADVPKGENVLIMDDLIATGGTLKAAAELLREAGAEVTDVCGVVGLPFLSYDSLLKDAGLRVTSLLTYQSE